MNVFFGPGNRRAVAGEIHDALQRATDATPVSGFGEMLELGDAVVNTDRISGFAETHDRREWLLALSARKGMAWLTDPVPDGTTGSVVFVLNVGFDDDGPLPVFVC